MGMTVERRNKEIGASESTPHGTLSCPVGEGALVSEEAVSQIRMRHSNALTVEGCCAISVKRRKDAENRQERQNRKRCVRSKAITRFGSF